MNIPEFDNHPLLVNLLDGHTNLRGYIAIHRGGIIHPSFGATRIWNYQSEAEAQRDALKLARIMSYKSALAGLPYGGAKAVLMVKGPATAEHVIAYAKLLRYLNGHFVTGADVGVTPAHLKLMKKHYPAIVGFRLDPVAYTVKGVRLSLDIVLQELFNSTELQNRTFAIQGLGKTGWGLLETLRKDAKKIYVTDVDTKKIAMATRLSPTIVGVSPQDIFKQHVDIFSPCALSDTINTKTIQKLHCLGIVGSANCQLANPQIGIQLFKYGILYAPDYIINAGGLMTVTDEYQYKKTNVHRVDKKVASIPYTLKKVLAKSKKMNKAPNIIADEMAKKISDTFT